VSDGDLQREPVVHLRELVIFVVQFQEPAGRRHFPSGGLRLTKAARLLYRAHLKLGTWIDGSPILYRTVRLTSKRYLGHLVARVTLELESTRVSRSLNLTVRRNVRSF
jgi:hypothetical protein